MFFRYFFIIALVHWGTSALAAPEKFDLDGKKLGFDLPENWQSVKDFYGMPLAFLGPMKDESRPVISVTRTNLSEKMIGQKDFEAGFSDSKKEKLEWLAEHKGNLLRWTDAQSITFGPVRGLFIASEFLINSEHFIEKSFYLFCGGELLNVKYQAREEVKETIPQMEAIVRSLKCDS